MPRRRKHFGPPSQSVRDGNMWGLAENKSSSDSEDFPHSNTPENKPFYCYSLEYIEGPYGYRPGGLHPIHIEDSLDSERYTVIHKLGYGLSSTVWLARDGTLNKYVAIKILTAEASKTRNELGCLEYLSSKPRPKHPGYEYISASFLDRHFWLDGPNGRHLVLVSKVSGPSISQITKWVIGIRESLARKIALQLTQGLAYLHSEGICHGNLTHCDVLFQLTNFDAWSQEKVYEQLGTPMVQDLDEWSREPSVPRYLVDSAQFFRASPGLLAESIRIIDYGDSFRVGWPTDLGDRVSGFSPPENLRGLKATRSSDLWALGCIIFEIRSGDPPFPAGFLSSTLDALWEIEDTLGSIPSDLASFDQDGDPYSKLSAKRNVSIESAMRISQLVTEIDVEPIINSESAARNRYAQIRPYIKSDPHLFWKPEPAVTSSLVDRLIRPLAEIRAEREMWKGEKPSPKISSTEAEQLSNLLSLVLSYFPRERQSAASLVKHPWFVEPVSLESSRSGKSQKGK